MAMLERLNSVDEFRASLPGMEPGELVGQQLILRSTIATLVALQKDGCKPADIEATIMRAVRCLAILEHFARDTGVKLLEYERPGKI